MVAQSPWKRRFINPASLIRELDLLCLSKSHLYNASENETVHDHAREKWRLSYNRARSMISAISVFARTEAHYLSVEALH